MRRNPAFEMAKEKGRWVICPACLGGFLDLHCLNEGCTSLRCLTCGYVIDTKMKRFALDQKETIDA